MEAIAFRDIILRNRKAEEIFKRKNIKPVRINVLSNISVHQLSPILEYKLRKEEIYATCNIGNYDNIVQDSINCSKEEYFIIFWELSDFIPGLHYKLLVEDQNYFLDALDKFKAEIAVVFSNLKSCPIVLFNKLTTLSFNFQNLKNNRFDDLCDEMNKYIIENKPDNFFLVNIDRVLSTIGVNKAVNFDAYYVSKSLYTVDFYKEYVEYISYIFFNILGKTKKALILDCDNTLWFGVLGEDGPEGIQMSGKSKKGGIYEEIQYYLKELVSQGLLLSISSKNNQDDVLAVINSHPDIKIKEGDIVEKKINWERKDVNIKSIASNLNIGMDSIVFLDDSDFEINLIKSALPEISAFKVPQLINLYPSEFRKLRRLFFKLKVTGEDIKRSAIYKNQTEREEAKGAFSNINEYLESLGIKIIVHRNDYSLVERIAQMTQKTNQFNLTTKRYTENEISQLMRLDHCFVYAIDISDKFGDSGISGLCILKEVNGDVLVDTFLLSCRVIGRNIEKRFFDYLIAELKKNNVLRLKASYFVTMKNSQVKDFYSSVGMTEIFSSETSKDYVLNIDEYVMQNINYITLTEADEREIKRNNG